MRNVAGAVISDEPEGRRGPEFPFKTLGEGSDFKDKILQASSLRTAGPTPAARDRWRDARSAGPRFQGCDKVKVHRLGGSSPLRAAWIRAGLRTLPASSPAASEWRRETGNVVEKKPSQRGTERGCLQL